jgi:hypothetical protein
MRKVKAMKAVLDEADDDGTQGTWKGRRRRIPGFSQRDVVLNGWRKPAQRATAQDEGDQARDESRIRSE